MRLQVLGCSGGIGGSRADAQPEPDPPSAIRAAGEAILVDLQPLLPPYRVEAVGDPEQLRARFAGDLAASYLQVLQSDGIGSRITTRQEITLSGAGATFHLQYARPVPTGAVASPSPTQEAS